MVCIWQCYSSPHGPHHKYLRDALACPFISNAPNQGWVYLPSWAHSKASKVTAILVKCQHQTRQSCPRPLLMLAPGAGRRAHVHVPLACACPET